MAALLLLAALQRVRFDPTGQHQTARSIDYAQLTRGRRDGENGGPRHGDNTGERWSR
jgi:hypothetical protein